jgi:hypothetical protein
MLLTELRKNPEKNLKQTPLQQLKQIVDSYKNEADSIFVTYTNVDKFGANPNSPYDTPLGICAYPIEYVIDREMEVPFGGSRPYVHVFKIKDMSTIWNLSDTDDFISIKQKLPHGIGKGSTHGIGKGSTHGGDLYRAIKQHITNLIISGDLPAGLRTMGIELRKILRKIGVSGIIDRGFGILHHNEPNQGIFFDIANLQIIKQIDNASFTATKYREQIKKYQKRTMLAPEQAHDIAMKKRTRSPRLEKMMSTDIPHLVDYIITKVRKRVLEWEPTIYGSSDAFSIAQYISELVKHPVPEVEDKIARNGNASLIYATSALRNNRFELGEPAIINSSISVLFTYIKKCVKGRWPAVEPRLQKNEYIWAEYQKLFKS